MPDFALFFVTNTRLGLFVLDLDVVDVGARETVSGGVADVAFCSFTTTGERGVGRTFCCVLQDLKWWVLGCANKGFPVDDDFTASRPIPSHSPSPPSFLVRPPIPCSMGGRPYKSSSEFSFSSSLSNSSVHLLLKDFLFCHSVSPVLSSSENFVFAPYDVDGLTRFVGEVCFHWRQVA